MRKGLIFHEVEQNTPEWFNARKGKVTGSVAAPLLSKARTPDNRNKGLSQACWHLIYKLVGSLSLTYNDEPNFDNFWTSRGKILEPDAIKAYQLYTFNPAHRVGFVEWPDRPAGFSPDFMVDEKRGGEIKCLKIENHIGEIESEKIQGSHMAQVQWNLFVSGFEIWDIVHYHPYCGKKTIHVKEIIPIAEYQDRYDEVLPIIEKEIKLLLPKYQLAA